MSSSKWLAAAALMALAVPAVQAGDRTRVQVTIAPYWGWDGPVRHVHGPARRGYYDDGWRDRRYGESYGFFYGSPQLRFEYRSGGRDSYYRPYGYRPYGYRPGGDYRYDSRRERGYGRGRDGHDRRDWRDWRDRDGRDRDGRYGDRRGW